jgi:hypothetical protein
LKTAEGVGERRGSVEKEGGDEKSSPISPTQTKRE